MYIPSPKPAPFSWKVDKENIYDAGALKFLVYFVYFHDICCVQEKGDYP